MPRVLTGMADPSGRPPRRRLILWRVALAGWSVAVAANQAPWVNRGKLVFPDAYTYFAAAQRLNVHHLLYRLSPGDIRIALHPPYWSVPILSPPFMAVLWRPLAKLGYLLGGSLWMVLLALAMVWAAYEIFVVAPAAVAAAAPGLGALLGSGNIHGFLFAALVAMWLWRGRARPAALLGIITAAKVMPVVFVPWLISERRLRPLVAYVAAAAVCTVIGVVGARLSDTLQYPGIMLSSAPQPVSLSYLTGIRWLSLALTIAGMLATLGLRGARAYQMAVLTLVPFNPSGIGYAGGSLLVLLALPRGARESTEGRESPAGGSRIRSGSVGPYPDSRGATSRSSGRKGPTTPRSPQVPCGVDLVREWFQGCARPIRQMPARSRCARPRRRRSSRSARTRPARRARRRGPA